MEVLLETHWMFVVVLESMRRKKVAAQLWDGQTALVMVEMAGNVKKEIFEL